MKLRSHLLWLTLVTLLPMVVFGVSAAALIAQREREVFRRGAQERTLALVTALDTELAGHLTSLRALASSQALESGHLEAFHREATRVLRTQPHWRSISLAQPTGERLFMTAAPYGTTLSAIRDRPSLEAAVRTGEPAIGDLVVDDNGQHRIPLRLPILADRQVAYVLTVLVDPAAVLDLLSPQRLPSDWVGVVLDGNQRIVARTVDPAATLGLPASDSLRAAIGRANEGWFQGITIEGAEVYSSFNRSSFSGWTVALGIPAEAVEAAATSTGWLLAAGTLAAVGTALVLAGLLAGRISRPIVSLAAAATDLGRGRAVAPPERQGVREVNDVQQALARAASVIGEREAALKAAHRAKDEFLAMLSHELRNPLGALSSAVTLLRLNPPGDPTGQAAVAAIGRQVTHITRLVDDLLDVSRATSGKIRLSREPRDLAGVVLRALEAMRAAGQLADRDLSVETTPVWVETDETRMSQIVVNLVGNAVKYTQPSDRIAVRVYASNGEAVLEVEDSGAGITPELLPHVFDVFVQGDRSLDRRVGGLGLGLTLVKRLAELHGGRVAAESAGPGRGARFRVSVPAVAPMAPVGSAEVQAMTPRSCRVLLIEDHEDARQMMRTGLEHYGHTVFEAADGPAGIEQAASVLPDVIVVDLGLPGLDGYEVATRLRAQPELATSLLVALSGYGQPEARQRAREAGFDAHLTKPVTPDELSQFIVAKVSAGVAAVEERPERRPWRGR
jgi:signal transduction histidine kinase/CheY-like chemotaxis protein